MALLLQYINSYIRRNYKMCILYILASGLMFATSGCYAVAGVHSTHEVVYTSHVPVRHIEHVRHVPCRPVSWCLHRHRTNPEYRYHNNVRYYHNSHRHNNIRRHKRTPKLYKRTVRRNYDRRGKLRRRVIKRRYR